MLTTAVRPVLSGLEDLRCARLRTVQLITPLSQRELDFISAPGKWSVGEIVDHIILTADAQQTILKELICLKRDGQRPFVRLTFADFDVFFAFVPKSLLPKIDRPFSLFSRFLPGTVRNFLLQNRVLPFSAPRSLIPRHGLPATELRNRLLASLELVNSAFQDNSDLDFQEMSAQHTLYGRVTMTSLPSVMARHEVRHQKQIRDVLCELNGSLTSG